MSSTQFEYDKPSDIIESPYPVLSGMGLDYIAPAAVYFVDINTNYTLNDKGILLRDSDAIKNQIRNLLSTPKGSDPFEPTYGSDLPNLILDPITPHNGIRIENESIEAINLWMSRVVNLSRQDCRVTALTEQDGYFIQLSYVERLTSTVTYDQFNVYRN